ncbi:N-acetyltransferase [Candidatus Thorarchaeota archaeon]|nr:MAG: N-acetyltransferase [Candidatus Thorarchaeota archaeon]
MQDTSFEPYLVTKKDIKRVIETLLQAFSADPLIDYFIPEPERRLQFHSKYFNYRVRNGFIDGKIFATSKNIEGVVILSQSENRKKFSWVRAIRTGGMRLYRIAGSENVRKMREIESYVFSKRAECISEPYLYLGSLAVHTKHQGKGLGGKLIRHALEISRSQGILCVLDTQEEGLVKLYNHYGFEVVNSYTLPKTNISQWVMVKRP